MNFSKKYAIEDLLANESFLNFYFQKNEDDVLDWEDWRDESPENAALVAQAFALINRLALRWDADQIRAHWLELREQIQQNPTENWAVETSPRLAWLWWRWAAVAASFLVCFCAGWGWRQLQKQSEPLVLSNDHPDRLMIFKLADGTKLQVKPHSKILISKNFGQNSRDLHLSGEALFVVAPDAARPFRVFTADVAVTALGTTFNVRAVEGEAETKVILTEGKVKVEAPAAADVLNPGEEISFQNREKRLSAKRKITTPSEIRNPKSEIKSALQSGSWIHFNQTPFADVATSLEYNFNVRFAGIYPELRDQLVSYRFRGDRPLEKILQDLSIRCGFSFKISGSEVFIERELPRFEGQGE